ncbi:MAG TPA: ABA4-like family protein [Vicinamibacterales bacterium]|nr:ABA4-like family protein [Vicinamibacterales bacterium]
MTPEAVFSVANTLALLAWVVLVAFQRRQWATDYVVLAAVAMFAVAYAGLIGARWWGSPGGFSSMAAVSALFSDPWLLLAGWVHYLAFDLLVGRWEARDAVARRLSPWLVAPCLVLTFMFGPAGWLSYLALRRAMARA